MIVFAGVPRAGELRPDGVETLDVRYFSREEAQAAETPVWLDEILEDVFADPPVAAFRPARWSPPHAT